MTGKKYTEAESLFFKFQGYVCIISSLTSSSDEAMKEVARSVKAVTQKHGGKNFEFSKSDKEAAALWEGRKAALWSVLALREGGSSGY
jgi:D-lactate dehydrogenase (cytochrome)